MAYENDYLNHIDHDAERAAEDRKDLFEAEQRAAAGVHLCHFCGEPSGGDVACEGPDCSEIGCKACMFYDAPSLSWYCSERCLGDKLGAMLDGLHDRVQTIIAQRDLLFEACTLAACSDSSRELIQYHLAITARQVREMK